MAEENIKVGCFSWVISFKKSVNERWARFRNRFRRRFYGRRGLTVEPATIVNETGTSDMIFSKSPIKCISLESLDHNNTIAMDIKNEVFVKAENEHSSEENTHTQVVEYVAGIITTAQKRCHDEKHLLPGNRSATYATPEGSIVSLSSSVISQMADAAVTDSLTNIALEADVNTSAQIAKRPRTVSEFMEMFGIAGYMTRDDGLPRVSE